MTSLLFGALGLMLAGTVGAIVGSLAPIAIRRLQSGEPAEPSVTLVLLLLLVSLRSGRSVLAALSEVADALPEHRNLRTVSRVALLDGLTSAIGHAEGDIRPVVAQLSRAQRSGASLSATVRHLLDTRLAEERASKIASARSLPVKVMLPVTLLMLPGLVLMIYAPSLLSMFDQLTGVLG